MNTKQVIVYPGQRVIATDGKVYTVAYERNGTVFAYVKGQPYRVTVCGDAFGGELDHEIGIAA